MPLLQFLSLIFAFLYIQMHQHPLDHHDHVSQPLNQVAQQPMPHQPMAIDHHHMQQLQPLSL